MTPTPPIHCSKERHKSRLCGRSSTFGLSPLPRILAPVVVRPLMLSKRASAVLVMAPDHSKGSAPRDPATTQARPTTARLSRRKKSSFRLARPAIHKSRDMANPMAKLAVNPLTGSKAVAPRSSAYKAKARGISWASEKNSVKPASSRATWPRFMPKSTCDADPPLS